jgi:hypothetical protein
MLLQKAKFFLQLIAIAHIIGGILLPFLVNTPLFETYNTLVYQALGFDIASANPEINFLIGLFGPTIASWGVLFLYVVTSSFRNLDQKGWWAIFLCCLAWAPYDSLLSIQKGIYVNALINLVSALAILTPLFVVRKSFFKTEKPQTAG